MNTALIRGIGGLGLILFLAAGCGEKTVTGHEDNFLVTLTVLQNGVEVDTVAVNVAADLVFEVVATGDTHSDGDHQQADHVSGLHMTIALGPVGDPTGEHGSTMEAHESEHEPGHYELTHTFAQAGTYEIHCSFDHDGEPFEEHFELVVE
jgi:plastocyanin